MMPKAQHIILGFDACLMSMVEVANIAKEYVNIMVGSQEVELGTGWNYARALQAVASRTMDSPTFAQHIVDAYQESYQQITNDFTQSAINLSRIDPIEENIIGTWEAYYPWFIYAMNEGLAQMVKRHATEDFKGEIKVIDEWLSGFENGASEHE